MTPPINLLPPLPLNVVVPAAEHPALTLNVAAEVVPAVMKWEKRIENKYPAPSVVCTDAASALAVES